MVTLYGHCPVFWWLKRNFGQIAVVDSCDSELAVGCVGEALGHADGKSVGKAEGSLLGTAVGAKEGGGEGEEVGLSVRKYKL